MTLGIKHVAIAPSSGCARPFLGFSEPNPNGGSGLNGRDQRSVWEEMFLLPGLRRHLHVGKERVLNTPVSPVRRVACEDCG